MMVETYLYVADQNVTHSTPQSHIDPVGAKHWNVWWDARHDATCTWQDVRDRKDQHEFEELQLEIRSRRSQGETERPQRRAKIRC